MIFPVIVVRTGRRLFVILRAQDGKEYFAPFTGFRQPVKTEGGVEFALPGKRVGGFAVGQKALIILVREADENATESALSIAEEWTLFDDYNSIFLSP